MQTPLTKRKNIYHKKCWSIFSQQYQWRTVLVFVVALLMSSWAVEFLYSSRPLMQTTFYRAALTRRVPHPPRSPRVTSLASLCSPVALTPTGASVSCSALVSVSALCPPVSAEMFLLVIRCRETLLYRKKVYSCLCIFLCTLYMFTKLNSLMS